MTLGRLTVHSYLGVENGNFYVQKECERSYMTSWAIVPWLYCTSAIIIIKHVIVNVTITKNKHTEYIHINHSNRPLASKNSNGWQLALEDEMGEQSLQVNHISRTFPPSLSRWIEQPQLTWASKNWNGWQLSNAKWISNRYKFTTSPGLSLPLSLTVNRTTTIECVTKR